MQEFTYLDYPAYLMAFPDTYDTKNANNIWMQQIPEHKRKVDKEKAIKQWLDLYNYIASSAYVMTLTIPEKSRLQDLVFVANLGIVLHTGEIIGSNFTSPPRKGETEVGYRFFDVMDDDYKICPHKFEGEADLKYLHDNIYIGGFGKRSERRSYFWMMDNFDIRIIPVLNTDEFCYHLDCIIFPITSEKTIIATGMLNKKDVAEIAKHTEIIDVSPEDAKEGLCNCVRLHNILLNACDFDDMDEKDKHKNQSLEKIAAKEQFELVYFNLSEFAKGGAALSCLIMHLNRRSYNVRLL